MNLRSTLTAVAVCFGLIAYTPADVFAQPFGIDGVENQGMSFNRFVRPGEATIQVWLISDNTSSLAEVGESLELGELIVLAGTGPGMTTARERRRTDVRVFRGAGATRELIYDVKLEELIREPGTNPDLRNGDVIMIETKARQRFQWRDALTVISAVSTSILLIDRIRRL